MTEKAKLALKLNHSIIALHQFLDLMNPDFCDLSFPRMAS